VEVSGFARWWGIRLVVDLWKEMFDKERGDRRDAGVYIYTP
jgi:hypothetical protein